MAHSIGKYVLRGCFSTTPLAPREAAELVGKVKSVVAERFPVHPFTDGITAQNAHRAMGEYIAMLGLLPGTLVGSQDKLMRNAMVHGHIPQDVQKTAAASKYLYLKAMTGPHVDSPVLQKDLKRLFGEAVEANYTLRTQQYLTALEARLSASNPVTRCSTMVGVDMHTQDALRALWGSLSKEFKIPKDQLEYFKMRVAIDGFAEGCRTPLAAQIIQDVVPQEQVGQFVKEFVKSYGLHHAWCQSLEHKEVHQFYYGLGVI